MANYIAIGVGELTGHAALVSVDSVSAEELFWAIDEHMNPYSCVFAKVNSISLYFPVKTVLETETEPENESFHDLNNITPTEWRNVEAGDAVGLRLNEWAQELWKHLAGKSEDEKSMSDEWMVFKRRSDHIVNYYHHEGILAYIDLPKIPRAKPKQEPHHHKKQETNAMSPKSHSTQQAVLNTTIAPAMTSAEALRKQAEELMKAAEAAEQRERNSAIRETVGPIQLLVAKSVVAIQKHVDGLVDAMSDLEKASEALRKALAN